MEQIHKGEPIAFSIEQFEDEAETTPIDLSVYDDVICYIYTDKMDKKKFARVKSGYTRYELDSTNFKLNGIVPGSVTKDMYAGQVHLESWSAINGKMQRISVLHIYDLLTSEIKAES